MIAFIYALCAATALVCAVLLLVGARRSRSRMLFWSGACFSLLTVANVVLMLDVLTPDGVALWPLRHGLTLAALSLLIYGLVMEDR